MSPMQKEFICTCLDMLNSILINNDELKKAITGYQNGDSDTARYCFQNITDRSYWTEDELLSFSSAVYEAINQTLLNYTDQSPNVWKEITQISNHFKTDLVPKLTKNTRENNRLQSVINNIKEIRSDDAQSSLINCKLGFFATLAIPIGAAVYYSLKK